MAENSREARLSPVYLFFAIFRIMGPSGTGRKQKSDEGPAPRPRRIVAEELSKEAGPARIRELVSELMNAFDEEDRPKRKVDKSRR